MVLLLSSYTCNRKDLPRDSRGTICLFRRFMDGSWEWGDFGHHSARPKMSRIATGAPPLGRRTCVLYLRTYRAISLLVLARGSRLATAELRCFSTVLDLWN